MRPILFAGLLLLSTTSLAQTGNYFLSNYVPDNERFDNVCYDQVQDARGVFFFATKAGVLEFDGTDWRMIPGQGAIYALELDHETGVLYWGGAKGFGRITSAANGVPAVQNLSGPGVRDVYQASIIKGNAYFVNDEAVYHLDDRDTVSVIKASNLTGSFTSLFELFGKPYVSTDQSGVYRVENGSLISEPLGLPDGSEVIFCARNGDNYLLGTSDNKLFRSTDASSFNEIILRDQKYAEASVVVSAVWVNAQLVALGTLRGGVVFINPNTGATNEIINYSTGLPDNEVYSISTDKNQNVWVAHDYGFTRIAPYFPFRSFSHYPGLQGNLLCAHSFKKNVYVGTSLGLFKLEKEADYEEIVYYVDVEVPIKQAPKPLASETPSTPTPTVEQKQPEPEPEKKKKGLFRFLKRNRNKTEEASEPVATKQTPVTDTAPTETTQPPAVRHTYRKEKRTEKILLSSHYVYKKVSGIEAKVTQLLEMDGKLYAAGLGGIFLIDEQTSTPVLEEPIRFAFGSASENLLITCTYGDEVRVLYNDGQRWRITSLLSDLDDQIGFIFKGNQNELWLCGLDKVYRITFDSLAVSNIQTIDVANPNFNEIAGVQTGETVLATRDGFYRFNSPDATFVKIDSLPKPKLYFANEGHLWFRDARNWDLLADRPATTNLQMLNLVGELRYIASDSSDENLWVITNGNELFKFYGEKMTIYNTGYPLFLKRIVNGSNEIAAQSKVHIEEQSAVSFDVVQPHFAGQIIEYRYMLKGIDQKWSDWSTLNRSISFPFLPVGQYTLSVQSRDIFGKISDMDPVSISVKPFFWRQSWFYAMEFAVFSLLVLLSFKLSVRYRFVSRLLSLLSIILLIEFIQALLGSTFSTNDSPIMNFVIQVIVAFLVLPVEGYLRTAVFRSIDSTSKMYKIAAEKKSRETVATKEEHHES